MNNRLRGLWKASLVCIAGFQIFISSHGQAASIVVTNLADSGVGSLRAAIANANDGDVVSFAVTGTITNRSGELVIDRSISIQGSGSSTLAISGGSSNRVFNVAGGVTVSLSGLTISDGRARDGIRGIDPSTPGSPGEHGGGIHNSGTLVLSNCVVTRCRSGAGGAGYSDLLFPSLGGSSAGGVSGDGGGIYNAGSLTLIDCSLMTNTCSNGGAGGKPVTEMFGSSGGAGGNGGGVYDAGNLIVVGCTFGFNTAGAGGAGGNGGAGTLDGEAGGGGPGGAGGAGGAVFSLGGPTFISCTFSRNAAGAGGSGGAGAAGWTGGQSFSSGNGGSGSDGGVGGAGGALMCSGAFQIIACTISDNTTGKGGNGAPGGSGGNRFGSPGGNGGNGGNGGTAGGGGGGNDGSGAASLQNVLVAQNSVALGGSGGSGGAGGDGFPRGSNGFAGSPGTAGSGPDLFGSYVSNGHNLIGRDDGNTGFVQGVMNDLVGSGSPLIPLIAPLANNGSSRPTCALLAGSPALDAGDDALLVPPHNLVTDQRGVPRQIGSHVDIGAFELRPAVAPIRLTAQRTNGVFLITLTNLPGASVTVLASTNSSTPPSNWTVLGPASEPVAGQFQFADSTNLPFRVYRVRSP